MEPSKQPLGGYAPGTPFFVTFLIASSAVSFSQSCASPSSTSPGQDKSKVSIAELHVPQKARSELRDAKKLINSGGSEKAGAKLQAALLIDPDYADALTLRAFLKLERNADNDALSDLKHSLQVEPNLAATYLGRETVLSAIRMELDAKLRQITSSTESHIREA